MHGQGAMLVQAAEVDAAPAVPPAAAAQPAPLRPALSPRHEGVHHHLRSGGTVDMQWRYCRYAVEILEIL